MGIKIVDGKLVKLECKYGEKCESEVWDMTNF